MKIFLGILVGLVSFFIFSANQVLAADVVINEIYANPENEDDEFIELYNTTDSEISLISWKIADKVKTYTLGDVKISARGFVSLKKATTGIQLNNSDEEVKIKNASDQDVDTFSYTSTITNKSWSRFPDGSGAFVNDTAPTEGSANSAPLPTSTPTPTNAPTPTKTPTPTKSPTPTKELTPTKLPTLVPSVTVKVSVKPTGRDVEDEEVSESDLRLASEIENDVLGKRINNDNTVAPSPQVLGESTSRTPFLFIGLGLIFLVVCGILAYFQFGEKIFPRFLRKGNE